MARLTVTSNAGWSMLQKAQAIANVCRDDVDALASIVLAYSALEAFVSELEWLSSREVTVTSMAQLGVFLEALEANHAPIRSKLDAITLASTGRRADWGCRPFQDLAHLKLLRDWGVHPKPVVGSSGKNVEETREAWFFVDRGLIDERHIGNHATWNSVVLAPPVALWACATVRDVIDGVVASLPPSGATDRAGASWQRAGAPRTGI